MLFGYTTTTWWLRDDSWATRIIKLTVAFWSFQSTGFPCHFKNFSFLNDLYISVKYQTAILVFSSLHLILFHLGVYLSSAFRRLVSSPFFFLFRQNVFGLSVFSPLPFLWKLIFFSSSHFILRHLEKTKKKSIPLHEKAAHRSLSKGCVLFIGTSSTGNGAQVLMRPMIFSKLIQMKFTQRALNGSGHH